MEKQLLTNFSLLMEKELKNNEYKGNREDWLSLHPMDLIKDIYYHVGKLQSAVRDDNNELIKEHSADIAVIAMMVLDNTHTSRYRNTKKDDITENIENDNDGDIYAGKAVFNLSNKLEKNSEENIDIPEPKNKNDEFNFPSRIVKDTENVKHIAKNRNVGSGILSMFKKRNNEGGEKVRTEFLLPNNEILSVSGTTYQVRQKRNGEYY